MLLWVNNHYDDFERDAVMEDYLETFERGLEQQVNRRNMPSHMECSFLGVTADSRYSPTYSQSNHTVFSYCLSFYLHVPHILTTLFKFVYEASAPVVPIRLRSVVTEVG